MFLLINLGSRIFIMPIDNLMQPNYFYWIRKLKKYEAYSNGKLYKNKQIIHWNIHISSGKSINFTLLANTGINLSN
jgi:hypothetical protein